MGETVPSSSTSGLRRRDLRPSPFDQFNAWFEQILATGFSQPNAMTLATATADGRPSARIVLLKSVDQRGFVFFSNYRSRKGEELEQNPRAALLFFWQLTERQIRIEGIVERLTVEESDEYFQSRPRESQIGAWASRQSEALPNRAKLEDRANHRRKQFEGIHIPLPPFWGGYRVVPDSIEFWQSRPNRLHDRFLYSACPGGEWEIERLSP